MFDLIKGLRTTAKYLFQRPVTISYPEVKRPVRERFRGKHELKRYEDGKERCIGCSLCAIFCPAQAIYVEAAENSDEARFSPGERYARRYEINMIRCIYCGFCQESCPTGAIELKDNFEMAEDNRADLIYTKERLLVPDPNRERVD